MINYPLDQNAKPIVQCCLKCFLKENRQVIALYVWEGQSLCEDHVKEYARTNINTQLDNKERNQD
jgi:hypothetical protein